MKHFPFKILFITIFLPPIFYVLTLQALEGYFQKRESSELDRVLIQNQEALLEGRYTIQEEIDRNIGEYLTRGIGYRIGVRTRILVKTRKDHILYPTQFRKDLKGSPVEEGGAEQSADSLHYMEVAAENFRILNEGLIVSVEVRIRHNSWLANSILVLYVFLFVLILRVFIRRGIRETERLDGEQRQLIDRLSADLAKAESHLKTVEAKEDSYRSRIEELGRGKQDLSKDVEGLLEEMEKLEAGLEEQKGLKEEMELQVLRMREELDSVQEKARKSGPKKKKPALTRKRFGVLYKNLQFTDRAIEGFLSLTDEFQLKAEEMIHKLNEDETLIAVKRKVFGKGGKMNILEADFSYSGRIYFQKYSQSGIKILAIGTKNTQERDLTYLERIS